MIFSVPHSHVALVPIVFGAVGLLWWIPIIAGLAASYLGNKANNGGNNSGGGSHPGPGVPNMGAQDGMIFEQGSPYWPGSQPVYPSNWQQQATGQGAGGGGGGGSSSQSRSDTTSTTNMSTYPFITPEYAKLGGLVRSMAEGKLTNPSALPAGYQANGVANINDIFDATSKALGNRLSSAGLSGPMAGGAYGGFEQARGKALSQFTNDLPMQERQLRNEDLQLASTILEAFGRGQKQQGTTKSTTISSGSSSGGGGGGAAPQMPLIGDAIAQRYFQGQGQQGGSNWLQQALGYASLIAGIYSAFKGSGNKNNNNQQGRFVDRPVGT